MQVPPKEWEIDILCVFVQRQQRNIFDEKREKERTNTLELEPNLGQLFRIQQKSPRTESVAARSITLGRENFVDKLSSSFRDWGWSYSSHSSVAIESSTLAPAPASSISLSSALFISISTSTSPNLTEGLSMLVGLDDPGFAPLKFGYPVSRR